MKSRDELKQDAVKHKSQAMMRFYKKVQTKVNSLNVLLEDNILPIGSLSIKATYEKHGRKLKSFSIKTRNLQTSPL